MAMNNWLPGCPIIYENLLISGQYYYEIDDTVHYIVYDYPSMAFNDKFDGSRYSSKVITENTWYTFPSLGDYLNGDKILSDALLTEHLITPPETLLDLKSGLNRWTLSRDLFPSFKNDDKYLERIFLQYLNGYGSNIEVIHYKIITSDQVMKFSAVVQLYKEKYVDKMETI